MIEVLKWIITLIPVSILFITSYNRISRIEDVLDRTLDRLGRVENKVE
jgi:hypothetical protein